MSSRWSPQEQRQALIAWSCRTGVGVFIAVNFVVSLPEGAGCQRPVARLGDGTAGVRQRGAVFWKLVGRAHGTPEATGGDRLRAGDGDLGAGAGRGDLGGGTPGAVSAGGAGVHGRVYRQRDLFPHAKPGVGVCGFRRPCRIGTRGRSSACSARSPGSRRAWSGWGAAGSWTTSVTAPPRRLRSSASSPSSGSACFPARPRSSCSAACATSARTQARE